ncbi:hypothetical protein B0H11DRAFT_1919224 [Mycena galericulata]|nr:hypothetical protein B0H11DRAFT_1919224 [Mycena galericulata]
METLMLAFAKKTGRRIGLGDHMYLAKVLKKGPAPGGKHASLDEIVINPNGFPLAACIGRREHATGVDRRQHRSARHWFCTYLSGKNCILYLDDSYLDNHREQLMDMPNTIVFVKMVTWCRLCVALIYLWKC